MTVTPPSSPLDQALVPVPGLEVGMIWAQSPAGVIGADSTMAWHIPEDFAHFKQTTMGSVVIMGRKTWQSLPPRSRPLEGRHNIVITGDAQFEAPSAHVVTSPQVALDLAASLADGERVWVIGGGQIYAQFLPVATVLAVTTVNTDVSGQAYAPTFNPHEWNQVDRVPATGWAQSRGGLTYAIKTWTRDLP